MEQKMTEAERRKLQAGKENVYSKPLISDNPASKVARCLFWNGFVLPAFHSVFRLLFALKIENREITKELNRQKKGYVTVCNHVYVLDSLMITMACGNRHPIFTSQEETFYINGLRTLLRTLECVPILKEGDGLKKFLDEMCEQLKKGRVVNVYPEATIETMCDHLRPFSKGAFTLAQRAGVPVVPMVITPREKKGLWKLLRKNYSMTITIGKPIQPVEGVVERIGALKMMEQAIASMNKMLEEGGHAYPAVSEHNPDAFWQVKKSKQI